MKDIGKIIWKHCDLASDVTSAIKSLRLEQKDFETGYKKGISSVKKYFIVKNKDIEKKIQEIIISSIIADEKLRLIQLKDRIRYIHHESEKLAFSGYAKAAQRNDETADPFLDQEFESLRFIKKLNTLID